MVYFGYGVYGGLGLGSPCGYALGPCGGAGLLGVGGLGWPLGACGGWGAGYPAYGRWGAGCLPGAYGLGLGYGGIGWGGCGGFY